MPFVYALAGLAFLVLVHELAHYLTAKALGLNAFRFMLFFPPTLLRRRLFATEWGIGLIPLGGFVSIAGMRRPDDVSTLRIAKQLGEEGAEIVEQLERVVSKGEQLPDTLYAKARQALGGSGKGAKQLEELRRDLGPDAYWRAAPWRRMATIAAGPLASLALAFVLVFSFLAFYAPSQVKLTGIIPASPAAKAGLKSGDIILAVNGRTVTPGTLSTAITASTGASRRFQIERDHRALTVVIVPRRINGALRIGVTIADNPYHGHPLAAADHAVALLWQTTRSIGGQAGNAVSHPVGKNAAVSGPVGIVDTSSSLIGTYSLAYWPIIFGLVSLALALTNALPIPPLDGGHFLIALVEWIRRKPLSARAEQLTIAWGVMFVVVVMGLGLTNDLLRL